ncbi:MAG: zinc-dependent peptidase [Gammaproteobacteria bacterium]|nr:zinc-dependent peptidase [Gammaproteobacteria bacterium]MCP4090982.1 zinc-dependent peptidase [Gammaproteobacteria bacterium]MCP4277492.1 zinc-dependent peptidase [Gammaproteobacteria bacterium]MCP4831447.1 zinc-dependent peptidase [Gammaproteobacteria bacterium]MCP4928525.1 zinc-dependent peptidase [Gammaproteobacteria bacterium]
MSPLLVIIGIVLTALITVLLLRRARVQHLQQFADKPLEPELLKLLRQHMPLYERMPLDLQQRLQGLVNVFLNDKSFFGCSGLEITDEMRLAVAGNACLLLLNRDDHCFPGSHTILLYPDTIVTPVVKYDGPIVHESTSARLGESWHRGPVILSWADILRGINNPEDGHNVVIHEFAHKLDEENVSMDGLPVLHEHADYPEWARVMSQEFADLIKRVQHNRNKVLSGYGSTSPAEFFAVASEAFFEKGKQMQNRLPKLYALLEQYYGVDTVGWGSTT